MKKLMMTCLLAFAVCALNAQQRHTLTGKVTDNAGLPVMGAAVVVEGTTNGTSTGIDGDFSLEVADNDRISVSFIGYVDKIVDVAGKTFLEITLEEKSESIDDVIVVAFGTAKKDAFTGSATVVKSDDIGKLQSSNIAKALSGRVAGVQTTTSSGQPGSGIDIRIRGFGSLNAGQGPLWVVDGMPYSGDLSNLNANDIESMTVLKDAASNALYGARGANGVIMVTTKRGRDKDATLTVEAKLGVNARAAQDYEYIKNPALYYETHYNALKNYYMNTGGYSEMESHRRANANLTSSANTGGLGYQVFTVPAGQDFIGSNGKVNPGAKLGRRVVYQGQEYWIQPDDWTKEAYRASLRQEYNASLTGSLDRVSAYISFGYLNDKGIVYNSDMERYTARAKFDWQAKKWFKAGINATYAHFNYNSIGGGGSNSSGNVFAYTAQVGPIYPLYIRDGDGNFMYNEDGIQLFDFGNGDNAGMYRALFPNGNALAETRLNKSLAEGNAFNGTGYFEISFLKDFKFTFNAGVSLDETRSKSSMNPWFGYYANSNGMLSVGHSRLFEMNLQQILTYNKKIGDHTIDAMIGHEYYNSRSYSVGASKSGMFSPDNLELNGAITDLQSASSGYGEYNNEGYFSRLMYDYDSRFFASASYRRDASSRFHPKYRWGNFWSVGGAWIISRENFMYSTRSWLDNLKLKASIGSQGNDSIGDFRYTNTYSIENSNGQVSTVPAGHGSEKITWETNSNFNAGIEFGVLKGVISGGIEYFHRKTTDMLLSFPVAPSMGYSSYYANVGDMVNQGVEIELNFVPVRRENVYWDISLNMTHLRNKITMLPQERRNTVVEGYEGYVSGSSFYGEGLPVYTFYMPKYAGVDEEGLSTWYVDETDDDNKPTGRKITTTDYAEATKYLCGNPIPKLYGGFSTGLTLYGVDLTIDFTYQIGGLVYDSGYVSSMYSPANSTTGLNWHKDILKAWSPSNTGSDIPRLQYEDQNQNAQSDRFIMDASFLNIQSINLGYTIPQHLTRRIKVDKFRVFLSCDNVWYWSRRKGLDPRQSFSGGSDHTVYSPVRTISGGVTIQF
ncbi:MAG: TonB-dependent receptor [Alistipes sp.]|nr:TonB-dependent receptor [Alistipes sp.]